MVTASSSGASASLRPQELPVHEGPVLLASGHIVYVPPVEFDVASAPDAMSEIDHLVDLHPRLAIDLSVVEFIDSSGLSALLYAHKRAAGLGGDVALFGPSKRTLRLLEITQLDRVFSVYDDAASIPSWSPERPPD